MDIVDTIRKAEAWMDEREGVIGVAQGERNGQPVVEVFVRDAQAGAALPDELDGYKVVPVQSDDFTSY